jgi:preprotein translocase subunit SecB
MLDTNARIQIQTTYVTSSVLQVHVPAHRLTEPLRLGLGINKSWAALDEPGHYAAIVGLQVSARTASGTLVFLAEANMEQVSKVECADDELTDIVELHLPTMLLPYVRAQIAALLLHSGYHNVVLPIGAVDPASRATKRVLATPPDVPSHEGVSA